MIFEMIYIERWIFEKKLINQHLFFISIALPLYINLASSSNYVSCFRPTFQFIDISVLPGGLGLYTVQRKRNEFKLFYF